MTQKRLPLDTTRASQFGPEYEQLLLTIWKKTPFRFPFASGAEARSFRGKFYTYFRHLRAENIRLDLIEMADKITLRLEDDNVLVFMRNEETWDHQKIRDILGLHKDAHGLTPLAPGQELQSPDLFGARLGRKLEELRQRNAGGQQMVAPFKTE